MLETSPFAKLKIIPCRRAVVARKVQQGTVLERVLSIFDCNVRSEIPFMGSGIMVSKRFRLNLRDETGCSSIKLFS